MDRPKTYESKFLQLLNKELATNRLEIVALSAPGSVSSDYCVQPLDSLEAIAFLRLAFYKDYLAVEIREKFSRVSRELNSSLWSENEDKWSMVEPPAMKAIKAAYDNFDELDCLLRTLHEEIFLCLVSNEETVTLEEFEQV